MKRSAILREDFVISSTFKVSRYTLHSEVRVELESSEVWWVGECCYFAEVGWLAVVLVIGQPHLAQHLGSATCNLLFYSRRVLCYRNWQYYTC